LSSDELLDLHATVRRIERRIISLQSGQSNLEEYMSELAENLRREITEARQAMDDSLTRIQDLASQIVEQQGDREAVAALTQELSDETDKLRAALPNPNPAP
jgi:predicted transcriptional regulator